MQRIQEYARKIIKRENDWSRYYLGIDQGKYIVFRYDLIYAIFEKEDVANQVKEKLSTEGFDLEQILKEICSRRKSKRFENIVSTMKKCLYSSHETFAQGNFDLTGTMQLRFIAWRKYAEIKLDLKAPLVFLEYQNCLIQSMEVKINLEGLAIPRDIRKMIIDWWRENRSQFWSKFFAENEEVIACRKLLNT